MNCGCSETRARTQAMICSETSLSPRPVVSFAFAKAFLHPEPIAVTGVFARNGPAGR